jgi:hypothetical protein
MVTKEATTTYHRIFFDEIKRVVEAIEDRVRK